MNKTTVRIVPVTAEIQGERVVVGEASLVATEENAETVSLDLDSPEGLNLDSIIGKGFSDAVSVSSDNPDLVNILADQNKKFKEENPNDGTA